MILLPGADMSGLARLSYRFTPLASVHDPRVGPRELNDVMPSSLRLSVPKVLTAPTVSADGSSPGEWICPYTFCPAAFLPLFPAAATTTTPRFTSVRTVRHIGSFLYESIAGAPRLMFTTRILYFDLLASTQFSAPRMLVTEPTPCELSTLRLTRFAPEAIPS